MNYQEINSAYNNKKPQYLGYETDEKINNFFSKPIVNHYLEETKGEHVSSSWKYRNHMINQSQSIKKRNLREAKSYSGRYIPQEYNFPVMESDLKENYMRKYDMDTRKFAPNVFIEKKN